MSFQRFAFSAVALILFALVALTFAASVAELKVTIKEYDVPTPKSHPHDPAVGPDGSLWWTGQLANKLGRLDPRTGSMKEYTLKTAKSGPHGLAFDRDGNVWFTGNFAGYIGKLNPQTGAVSEYKLPDPRATDPHTLVFDQRGIIWFTVQNSNFVGRLDPRTGKMELKQAPSPHALPYGIVMASNGTAWFCEFGAGKLASIDPRSMAITEYTMPPHARPRRLAISKDDVIYYTDYDRGYLGQFDTRTKKQQEWASPGGPNSAPYGIAITPDGMVWYSESEVEPNTLVRFNPTTHEFSERPIPSGGGVVRNMAVTPDGRIYLACSGVDKVAIVTP